MPSEDTAEGAAHFEAEEIRAVIDHYDDPDHPDALSVAEARESLSALQAALVEDWAERLAAIRDGTLRVVHDGDDVAILVDPERRQWSALLDDMEVYDTVERTVLRMTHHQAAVRIAGREFESADPMVVRKPPRALAGQRFAEAVVNGLCRRGPDPGEAWAYYGVAVRGYDGADWAERGGYDGRVAVADAVETAREGLDR